jgi:hypothetical protein
VTDGEGRCGSASLRSDATDSATIAGFKAWREFTVEIGEASASI